MSVGQGVKRAVILLTKDQANTRLSIQKDDKFTYTNAANKISFFYLDTQTQFWSLESTHLQK